MWKALYLWTAAQYCIVSLYCGSFFDEHWSFQSLTITNYAVVSTDNLVCISFATNYAAVNIDNLVRISFTMLLVYLRNKFLWVELLDQRNACRTDTAYLPQVIPIFTSGTVCCYLIVTSLTGEKWCKCHHMFKSFVFFVSCPCPVSIFLLGFGSFVKNWLVGAFFYVKLAFNLWSQLQTFGSIGQLFSDFSHGGFS